MTPINLTLIGIGQIFLQQNRLSGLLIVIAMFYSHWALGVSCLFGAWLGTAFAKYRRFPKAEIEQGLYGFNASLAMMCAIFTFGLRDASNPLIWLLGACSALLSTECMRWFLKKGLRAFTFPFVLSSWLCCWSVAQFHLFNLTQTTPPLAQATPITAIAQPFLAWAEIDFSSSLITGILLFSAVAIHTPIAAMYGLAVTPIAALLANALFGIDAQILSYGLYSFSAVLVACVFAGSQLRDLLLTLLGVLLAVIIQYAVSQTGLAAYTIGFIVASWLVLWLKQSLEMRESRIYQKLRQVLQRFNLVR